MKTNKWTYGLAAAGIVSLASTAQAEETFAETLVSGTTIGGYVSTSAVWAPGDDEEYFPGRTHTGMYKNDGFNLDAVKLRISNPVEDTGTWAAGFNVGLVFGHDASLLDTYGSDEEHSVAIQEAYITVRAPIGNGLDISLGVFPTVIGYEVFDHDGNDFFSRSYGFFTEPINHTGVLLSYEFNEMVAFNAGIANTGSVGFRNERPTDDEGFDETEKAILGNVVITAPESAGALAGSSLVIGAVYQQSADMPGSATSNDQPNSTNLYIGGTMMTPVDGLGVGFAFDYLKGEGDAEAWVLGGYAKMELSPKASVQGRLEYATSEDTGGGFFGMSDTSDEEELLGLTFAADYRITDNMTARGEIRYDLDLDDTDSFGSGTSAGSDSEDDTLMLALQAIYSF